MVNNQFFRSVQKMYTDLLRSLDDINQEDLDILTKSESCIIQIDSVIRKLKIKVTTYHFESIAEEVYFFKELKPKFIAEFLFYQQILNIESDKPHSGKKTLQKYYLSKIKTIEMQADEDKDFYNYYLRNATYLDQKYFVRHYFDLKMKLPEQLYNYDESFTTSHDYKVAEIMASQKIVSYIINCIDHLQKQKSQQSQQLKKMEWSSSKVHLVELIYALHNSRCFNAGTLELSETIKVFEKLLDVDLHNFHKVLSDIKSRKSNRTKFLQFLQHNLNKYFLDTDG